MCVCVHRNWSIVASPPPLLLREVTSPSEAAAAIDPSCACVVDAEAILALLADATAVWIDQVIWMDYLMLILWKFFGGTWIWMYRGLGWFWEVNSCSGDCSKKIVEIRHALFT